ncbi:MAG: hypothetical protein PHS31_09485 [Victivallaceae bacterium]|nr:hypothetical protein [Victivallaceae bacterium]
MDVEVKHLVLRKATYYFRRRLPENTDEVVFPLKTADLKTATARCILINDKLQQIMDKGALKMIPLDEIRKINCVAQSSHRNTN